MTMTDDYLDEGMRGWIHKTARKNLGRVANFDLDDLVQEGYFCYYKCRNRYVGVPPKPNKDGMPRYLPPSNPDKVARRHFQCLVQTTFNNRIKDLAFRQPKGWELAISDLAGERTLELAWESILPVQDEDASVLTLLKNAPAEFKQLFDLLIDDALGFTGYRRVGDRRRGRRETTNQRLNRLLLDRYPGRDISSEIERYFLQNV